MSLRIWIIKIGEPVPVCPGNYRLMRAGMLAQIAVNRGHDVLWWTSAFEHFTKTNTSFFKIL